MNSIQQHNEHVQQFFDRTELYLKNSFGIKIRIDIVRYFLGGAQFSEILDIGCGDGSISIALLEQSRQLTLLDISPEMLKKAKQNLPDKHVKEVRFIEGDYRNLQGSTQQYDVVLAIGILAHIHDPAAFFQTLQQVVKPEGYLILQFTGKDHLLPQLHRWIRKHHYNINQVNKQEVLRAMEALQFSLVDARQYGLTLPGFGYLPGDFLYRYERFILNSKLLSRTGTDHMLLLQKKA